jgi:SAM-dependent methyltransferase
MLSQGRKQHEFVRDYGVARRRRHRAAFRRFDMSTTELVSRYCPVCRATTEGAFRPGPGGRPDASCPNCRSLERERFLALVLDCLAPVLWRAQLFVDVAPSPRTSPLYRALCPQTYVRLDFDPAADGRQIDVQATLTQLPFTDSSVDAMVCYHVLEHIPDDAAAMREIARVLRAEGLAIVQVPWRPSRPTEEDPGAKPEERIRRFGQADHVRYYGVDFEDRLRAAGLNARRVTPRTLVGPSVCRWMNLRPEEAVWFLRPTGSPAVAHPSVQSTGALAASLEQARADAQRWRQRFDEVDKHWVLRSYRWMARPAARVLNRRRG